MKTISNVTLYACDHCGKRFQTKYAHDYHEAHKCSKNPNNQHKCFGDGFMSECKHLYSERCNDASYYHCNHCDRDMFTYKLGNKRRAFEENKDAISSGAMVRMPVECEFYEKMERP